MLSEPFVRLISIIVYVLRSSYNVPMVKDVLQARMSKHGVFAGLAKCGGTNHHTAA
jgi:hypothetical protein